MAWLQRARQAAAAVTAPVCLLALASPRRVLLCPFPAGAMPAGRCTGCWGRRALLLLGCFAILAARRAWLPRRRLAGLCAMAASLALALGLQVLAVPGPLLFYVFAVSPC